MQADILIKNGIVLPMDPEHHIYKDGAVAIKNGAILETGDSEVLSGEYYADTIIDAEGMVVLPGFVNTHHHFMQTFLRGTRDDYDMHDWINKLSFPRIKVVVNEYRKGNHKLHYYAALHSGIDLLKSGVTTTVNMEWAIGPDVVDACDLTGIRALHALTLTDVKSWTPKEACLQTEEYFALGRKLIEKAKSSKTQRSEFAYGLACPNSCTDGLIRRARAEATESHVKLHIHLAESHNEYVSIKNKHCMTPTAYMEELGLWDRDVWAAHCIWLDDEDINILRKYGVGVSHNPRANMKGANGAAPVSKMLKSQVPVGLGIDSNAGGDNSDFFEVMRAAVFLQKTATLDPKSLVSIDALKMATVMGACVLKMEDQIGSLEPGKSADLIFIDLDKNNTRPCNDLVNTLVFAANASNVHTVMIAGEIVVQNGLMVKLDEEEVLREAEEYAFEIFRKEGLELPSYFVRGKKRNKGGKMFE